MPLHVYSVFKGFVASRLMLKRTKGKGLMKRRFSLKTVTNDKSMTWNLKLRDYFIKSFCGIEKPRLQVNLRPCGLIKHFHHSIPKQNTSMEVKTLQIGIWRMSKIWS
ncbi:uncharacterized protein LOC128129498 [Lactuca sativa]|uniref:uncharacterized protein LOC128128108 n=1 Tax=Lactuca sativa TaxID=4236 RepID=UPI0022AE62C7|nr:uncharacterized protein LOC128128108 [Lactuca sativa]XP_052622935.1 uncharacterized protein LOC128128140 isoform X3 [Lactuca sativa]XP_052623934.1 uncharacterized protein LOC111905868 [Lactuca sativa]XP_052623935.1 uncharacterized protein LOC128129498 [Lactuca sativa]